ncbi:MAG: DUF4097 family beta strand repeat-containing protein [Gemmatimonadota bacterium]
MRHVFNLLVLAALASTSVAGQERRSERAFTWDGTIPTGRWLYVRNLNGPIRVDRSDDGKVTVEATKRWRRGNPDEVRIEMRKIGSDNVLICALWTDRTECDEDGYRTRSDGWRGRNNDTSVEFIVRLPAGVRLVSSTVNGGLEIRGATSEVEASTINGSIEASSAGGPVRATTVNGSISVRMRDAGTENLEFETVNGTIEVWVPENLDAEVDMRTVNGRVSSDFPMTVSGRINPRHIRATIGKGGRRLRFVTVNGSIELRRM